jgi:hypothetical protein
MRLLNAPPMGLVVITNLDSRSVIFTDSYNSILDEFGALDLSAIGVTTYLASLPVEDTHRSCHHRKRSRLAVRCMEGTLRGARACDGELCPAVNVRGCDT